MSAHPVHLTPLTPLAFLERSADVFAGATAVVHGAERLTYAGLAARVTRLANALRASGVRPGDRIAYFCPNTPALLVAHFAVPLAGAVLVAINTRLAPAEIRAICLHSGSRMLVADTALAGSVAPVAGGLGVDELVWDDDAGTGTEVPGTPMAELLARGCDDPLPWTVADEDATISINYTSGTTGSPKGVMYTHRGAYLNALGENLTAGHGPETVYLWTLPMFHCNGWCHPWAIVAAGGAQVCMRAVRGPEVWRLIDQERVTHLNGAPAVLSVLVNAEEAHALGQPLTVMTAAAPPSPTILAQTEALGARVVHVYGLTETYGPYTVCQPQTVWAGADGAARARLLARQGVAMVVSDPIRVVDEAGRDVPRDGATVGEVVMRGNNVMKGYHDDPEATAEAFRGGVFHSGDLGVWHPDGYVELRDRAKDVVISGGENISTIEVEQAVVSHPAVLEAAVIGVPDERWGERPKAFVVLRPGAAAGHDELAAHVRARLAAYKCPDAFEVVEALPRTSTGKVRKFELRESAWAGRERRIN
ncbi:AMP-binding protein [Miltoncostaea marina]|uniref:AMP-binding protein n=1 Tax=Miltoncostaea marina TaxID=2843215 RepID=UPI001C3E50F4|nr:AMP-binding protein [Miltoncostaea marina]